MSDNFYIPPPANGVMCENAWREYLEAVDDGPVVEPRDLLPPEAFRHPEPEWVEAPVVPRVGPIPGPERWALLHTRTYTSPVRTASWFYKDWLPLSQEGCCGQVLDIVEEHPMDFSDGDAFFDSGIRLHNAVNRKLGSIEFGLAMARFIWRRSPTRRAVPEVALVSSLSPSRLDHQIACVKTWLDSGFKVYLLQRPAEIDAYRRFLRVSWVPIQTERPLIRDMVRLGMVINSDCSMAGSVPSLRINEFHLRWNYGLRGPAREEEWGLDACWIDPDALPEDFPFMIGEPFWDYAVPAFLREAGVPFTVRHDPWLHHLAHPVNWSREDWHRGHDWVRSRLIGDFSSPSYRRSLDPDYSYHASGLWLTDAERNAKGVDRGR